MVLPVLLVFFIRFLYKVPFKREAFWAVAVWFYLSFWCSSFMDSIYGSF